MELFGMALTTMVVIIVFAIRSGIAFIIGCFLLRVVAAAPILAVGSLIGLVPKPAEKARPTHANPVATRGVELTHLDTQTGEPA